VSKLGPKVIEALAESIDRDRFEKALEKLLPGAAPTAASSKVLSKILLADVLDDAILSARPGETSFPLRMFFGALGEAIDDDVAFALASALSFYFRVEMDDEATMRVGYEVSRLYYKFAAAKPLEKDLVREVSPLLARLMSSQIERLRFESVDSAGVYDSSLHERAPGSDTTRSNIRMPKSFLCRVVSNGMVRAKAIVQT
jgi:hypothetical protein